MVLAVSEPPFFLWLPQFFLNGQKIQNAQKARFFFLQEHELIL